MDSHQFWSIKLLAIETWNMFDIYKYTYTYKTKLFGNKTSLKCILNTCFPLFPRNANRGVKVVLIVPLWSPMYLWSVANSRASSKICLSRWPLHAEWSDTNLRIHLEVVSLSRWPLHAEWNDTNLRLHLEVVSHGAGHHAFQDDPAII